jgi:hypothetical protein
MPRLPALSSHRLRLSNKLSQLPPSALVESIRQGSEVVIKSPPVFANILKDHRKSYLLASKPRCHGFQLPFPQLL